MNFVLFSEAVIQVKPKYLYFRKFSETVGKLMLPDVTLYRAHTQEKFCFGVVRLA